MSDDKISEDEHDSRMNEKKVISAWAENQWPVKFARRFLESHESLLDEEVKEELEEKIEPAELYLEKIEEDYERDGGYDTEAIASIPENKQDEIAEEFYSNTGVAIEVLDTISDEVEQRSQIKAELPDLIDEAVQGVFEEMGGRFGTGVTQEHIDEVYQDIKQDLDTYAEDNIDQETAEDIVSTLEGVENQVEGIYEEAKASRQNTDDILDNQNTTHANQDKILKENATESYVSKQHEETREVMEENGVEDSDRRDLLKYLLGAGAVAAIGLAAKEFYDEMSGGGSGSETAGAGGPTPVDETEFAYGRLYEGDDFIDSCLSESQVSRIDDHFGEPENLRYEPIMSQGSQDGYIINVYNENNEQLGYLDNESLTCEVGH